MGITDKFSRDEPLTTRPWGVYIVAVVFGLLAGFVAFWATYQIGYGGVAFLAVASITVWALAKQPLPSAAIARGLYINAALLVLVPVFIYVPTIMNANTESAEAAGSFIGSLIAMIVYGIAFFLGAVFIVIIAYLIDRRAQRKLAE